MIVEVQGEIIVFGNGNAAIGGAAPTGEDPFDRIPPDAMLAEQTDLKYQDIRAGRFTVTGDDGDNHGDANEVQGKDRNAAIHKRGPRSPATKDKPINYIRIGVGGLTLSRPSRRITDDDETPRYIPPEDERRTATLSGTPAAPFG